VTSSSFSHSDFLRVVGSATRLIVLDGYRDFDPKNRAVNNVLVETRSPRRIASAMNAMQVGSGPRMDWMEPGAPTLVFLAGQRALASVRCLPPDHIRCVALWEGDAPLLNSGELQLVLLDLAVDTAQAMAADDIAMSVIAARLRSGFRLSPSAAYQVLRRAGLEPVESKQAVDLTITELDLSTDIAMVTPDSAPDDSVASEDASETPQSKS